MTVSATEDPADFNGGSANMPYAAILNSRQSKTPVGDDPWVAATRQAVRHAVERNYTILGSVGLNTWELVTWAAGECGGRVLVYVPYPYAANIEKKLPASTTDSQFLSEIIRAEFSLGPSTTEFRFQNPTVKSRTKKSNWPLRDEEILNLADIYYPISIRPGGNLEKMIAAHGSDKKICDRFCVPYRQGKKAPGFLPGDGELSAALSDLSWPYITHWTRSANGKWPGETAASYYRDLAHSTKTYARSGLATLCRIIREQRLRASSHHIRGEYPVVAFTAHPPHEAIKLMRWRRRYVRWNFEPYGIAIKKDYARSIGARPVIYGAPGDYYRLGETDRPFFQNRGTRGGDWKPENEWRYFGDLDLRDIAEGQLKIIVRSKEEIGRIESLTGAEIEPLRC